MNKAELAQYLADLRTLMSAQDAVGLQFSTTLATEYEKNWGLLKDAITKENENEARSRNNRNVDEGGTNPARDQSRRGSTDRHDGDLKPNRTR